jgi:hypothetical protein
MSNLFLKHLFHTVYIIFNFYERIRLKKMIRAATKNINMCALLLLAGLIPNGFIYGQLPLDALQLGGEGIESLSHINILQNGNKVIAGTFDEAFEINGINISNTGENDVFLTSIDDDNLAEWVVNFGSDFDDEITAITYDGDQSIFGTGSFWLETQIGDIPLLATKSPKSIYLTKIDAITGDFIWAKTIEGSDVKISTDLEFIHENNIILTGYFSDTLFIGDTILYAQSLTDMFVASFDEDGHFNWARNFGYSGVNKILEAAILSNDNIIISGVFNDTLLIADTTLIAETFDDDVFIACLSPEGETLWATKAGGVHEENILDIEIDDSDQIYVSGHFVGVINLDNDLSIQSSTGWADLFVLKYSPEGAIMNAQRFGGSLLQHNSAMAVTTNHVFLTGTYRGEMTIGNDNFNAGAQTAGFVLRLDHNLEPLAGWTLKSFSNNVFPTNILSDDNGNFIVGGGYGDEILGIDMLTPPMGLFDIFLLSYPESSVNAIERTEQPPEVTVFPNPASEKVYISTSLENYRVELVDVNGKVVFSGTNLTQIDVVPYPPGIYFVRLFSVGVFEVKKVMLAGKD